MENVHIGETIRVILKERNIQIKKAASAISISEQGLHKALNKDTISMDLLERMMKFLDINLYAYLSKKWDNPISYQNKEDDFENLVKEDVIEYILNDPPERKANSGISNISLLINIDESRRSEVLKLIM